MYNNIFIFLKRKIKYILFSINTRLGTIIVYRIVMGYFPNLKVPLTFNEKIQWLKLNEYSKNIYKICADKYLVRDFIKQNGCEGILNELIGVYESPLEINFKKLPNQFVLKLSCGSGYNIICRNKKELNEKEIINKIIKWLKMDLEKVSGEPQTKVEKKYIVVEKYLGNAKKKLPSDYKFFCFNGKVKYIMFCDERETGKPNFYFFDLKWKLLDFSLEAEKILENKIEKPKNLSTMIKYAEKLSQKFYFVRVDLYNIDENIIFGELTFTPSGGLDKDLKYYSKSKQETVDEILGKELNLPLLKG